MRVPSLFRSKAWRKLPIWEPQQALPEPAPRPVSLDPPSPRWIKTLHVPDPPR